VRSSKRRSASQSPLKDLALAKTVKRRKARRFVRRTTKEDVRNSRRMMIARSIKRKIKGAGALPLPRKAEEIVQAAKISLRGKTQRNALRRRAVIRKRRRLSARRPRVAMTKRRRRRAARRRRRLSPKRLRAAMTRRRRRRSRSASPRGKHANPLRSQVSMETFVAVMAMI
jgi:hypothetical protein